MKIGLDYISASGKAGAGTYTRELIKNLALIDKDNDYYLYTYLHKKLFHKDKLIKQDNFKYRLAYLPYFTSQTVLRPIRKKIFYLSYKLNRLDLFHITNPANYYKSLDNLVITIHEIAPFYGRGFLKENIVLFYKKYFREIITKSKKIITDSNFTKHDILNNFDISEDKIKVIYLAANNIFKPTQNSAILKKHGITKKYILSVGGLQPRKNLSTLLKAYSLLSNKLKDEYDLVLVGSPREQNSLNKLKSIIVKEKIKDNVRILGYVDINELAVLYSNAYIFAYLSYLEGFGLPVLESLQCGRPALIANNSSLPEVAGLAGILVNPNDIEQIVFKMKQLLENQNLVDGLIKEIPNQIKNFSWQKTAYETLEVYKDIFY